MAASWTCVCGRVNSGTNPCSWCLSPPPAWATVSARPPMLPRRYKVLALIDAVVLVAALLGLAFWPSERAEPARSVVVAATDHAAPGKTEVEAALPGLMRFVQDARGLRFKRPVKVSLLGDEAFRRRLLGGELSEQAAKELETAQRVLEALGLLERGVDLQAAQKSLLGTSVAGFYDPIKDDLVVRGDQLTGEVRLTLVHELAHALQDQHFDIVRRDLDDRDDEASIALRALVEGDAVRVERAYLESLPPEEQEQIRAAESAVGRSLDSSIPIVLIQLLAFPYVFGPDFAAEVAKAGRIDEAFANPPSTSEHLLHPQSYLTGDGPKPVPEPQADGEQIDAGVLGEFGFHLVLLRTLGGARTPPAVAGWGGDRYVAWRDGDRTCVRVNVVMDTPADTTEMLNALRALARARKGVRVSGDGPISLTSCG